ncbi:hypothetical protein HMPREF1508_1872 [Shuttleworthella sp. MSX8B]|nr:hypothetical protein HMPREF1508_1872 [Shuttleworthia sp. MSX8B]
MKESLLLPSGYRQRFIAEYRLYLIVGHGCSYVTIKNRIA